MHSRHNIVYCGIVQPLFGGDRTTLCYERCAVQHSSWNSPSFYVGNLVQEQQLQTLIRYLEGALCPRNYFSLDNVMPLEKILNPRVLARGQPRLGLLGLGPSVACF